MRAFQGLAKLRGVAVGAIGQDHAAQPIGLGRTATGVLALAVLLGGTCTAQAGIIFNNFDADQAYGYANGAGFGVYFYNVAQNTAITNIQVRTDLDSAQHLTFVIFDDPTGDLLYQSAAKTFAGDTFGQYTYKRSDDFSFTLLAGHQYDIGYEADGVSRISSQETEHTENGLTSSTNPVIFYGGQRERVSQEFNSDYHIILEGPGTLPVPEPASLLTAAQRAQLFLG